MSRTSIAPRGKRAAVTAGACLLLLLLLLLAAAPPLLAQAPERDDRRKEFIPSPYLPLDHWAYPLLDHWLAAGELDGLSPFVRPYRRAEVARAIARLRDRVPGPHELRWLERLAAELRPEMDLLAASEGAGGEGAAGDLGYLRLSAVGGAAYHTQTHRDLLRPELEGRFSADRVLEHVFLRGRGRLGPIVGGLRTGRDGIYLSDAQFPDGRVVPDKNAPVLDELGVRVEEGWLELQSRYASLSFGRMDRNWGPPGLRGFVLSDYHYSQEAIAYRVGVDRLFLMGTLSSYRDFRGDTARYLSTHRLEVRPTDDLALAVTEAVLMGGPAEPLTFALVNPLGIWHLDSTDGDPPKNVVAQVDAWWRPARGVSLDGSLVVDNTNSPRTRTSCCQIGGSLGVRLAELGPLPPGWSVGARGTALQSLVYRTSLPWEVWALEGIGLGWDKVDLYLLSLEGRWIGMPGLVLEPRLDFQLAGAGHFSRPFPDDSARVDFPRILVGDAETTLRPALAGRWRPPLGGSLALDLEWDVGVNFISDWDNRSGVGRAPLVGRVAVRVESPEALFDLR